MDLGTLIWYGMLLVIGLVVVYLLWLLWIYSSPPIMHMFIKSGGGTGQSKNSGN